MATPQVDDKTSEAGRRALVRQIAGRKADVTETTASVGETNQALADAYLAAQQSDDALMLPPAAAVQEQAGLVNEQAGRNDDYQAALESIYQSGIGREAAYGQTFRDDFDPYITAVNKQLIDYEGQLKADEAARMAAASASRRGGGGGGGSGSDGVELGDYNDAGGLGGLPDRGVRLNAADRLNYDAIESARPFLEANADVYAAAEAIIEDVYFKGGTFGGAIDQVSGALRDMSQEDYDKMLQVLQDVWEPQFAQHFGDRGDEMVREIMRTRHGGGGNSSPTSPRRADEIRRGMRTRYGG